MLGGESLAKQLLFSVSDRSALSPRTVKQHLRTLFLRAGIRDGRKRVKLATAMFVKEQMKSCNPVNG